MIGIRYGLASLHRRLMATIEPLQREVAITIIRDWMRKRMAAGRSG